MEPGLTGWRRNVLKAGIALIILIACAALTAQAPSNKFKLRVGARLSGTEEYRIEKTAGGFRLSGTGQLEGTGIKMANTYEVILAPDRSLQRYKMDVQSNGREQIIEAHREGDKVLMRAEAGGQGRDRSVDFKPGTVLLDNLVTGPLQVLLDSHLALPAELSLLVPQQLVAVPGKLVDAGTTTGTLDGRPVTVHRYQLTGTVTMEILALPPSNLLLRAYVALQNVELVRDGFVPAAEKIEESPPTVQERTLTFPSGDLQFPATLCLPAKRTGRVPLLVLVHGSGAHDRDETIGPNKPFRDLAWDLAGAGIGTLRYDKRTFAFRGKLDPKLTVEEEVIADAVAAVQYAPSLPEADPQRIYLLGHSLGGALAPFIAGRTPQIRGVILMAGTLRPLDELIAEQTAFQSGLQGKTPDEIAQQKAQLKRVFARIRSGEAKDDERVMNAPALYWRDLLARDPRAAWQKLKLPVLVLQGGKDVQIGKTDFDGLIMALKPGARWFDNLNHLFMPVEGKPTGAEYSLPSHVDPEVGKVITAWVGKN